jgi:hypothetical protein
LKINERILENLEEEVRQARYEKEEVEGTFKE